MVLANLWNAPIPIRVVIFRLKMLKPTSSHNARYDLIISEPSNPWVSGVAGLFSEEFYRYIKGHLQKDGLRCNGYISVRT